MWNIACMYAYECRSMNRGVNLSQFVVYVPQFYLHCNFQMLQIDMGSLDAFKQATCAIYLVRVIIDDLHMDYMILG